MILKVKTTQKYIPREISPVIPSIPLLDFILFLYIPLSKQTLFLVNVLCISFYTAGKLQCVMCLCIFIIKGIFSV